jgi:hypothetical protein
MEWENTRNEKIPGSLPSPAQATFKNIYKICNHGSMFKKKFRPYLRKKKTYKRAFLILKYGIYYIRHW